MMGMRDLTMMAEHLDSVGEPLVADRIDWIVLANTPPRSPRKITPEPPAETNGREIPLVGMETVNTAMFITA